MVRVASDEAAAVYVGADSVWTANKPGMVLLTPTSITHAGTSASVGANGQVTFTAVTSLSLNGVFSADFDNYVIVSTNSIATGGNVSITLRLRSSGTDATGTDYAVQFVQASSTTVSAIRATGLTSATTRADDEGLSGWHTYVYGPAVAQPTAFRNTGFFINNGATIRDDACTHSLSTSYDGCTIAPASSEITGKLAVYGIRS